MSPSSDPNTPASGIVHIIIRVTDTRKQKSDEHHAWLVADANTNSKSALDCHRWRKR